MTSATNTAAIRGTERRPEEGSAGPLTRVCGGLALAALSFASAGAVPFPATRGVEVIPFGRVKLIIEFNSTAQDVGIQAFVDGEPWERLRIVGPDERRLAEVAGRGRVRELGLTELFFESEEPSLEDLPLEELLELFPEGNYRFRGRTVEGDMLIGDATFTHAIPEGPVIVSPQIGVPTDPENAVIRWNPVPDPVGSEIVGYQVIVEQAEPLRVFSVDLPASATRVRVPREFFDPSVREYKVEILAIEASGNQTITEGALQTE